jgi:hypothetical protein
MNVKVNLVQGLGYQFRHINHCGVKAEPSFPHLGVQVMPVGEEVFNPAHLL